MRNDDGNYFHAAAASGMRGWQTRRQFARHDADSTLSPATDNADNRAPGNVVSNDTGADLARMDGRDGSKKGAEMPSIIVALAQARERGN